MNLTILNEQHEPVLVLNQDERGLAVVGGDPKMVQTLGLSRFKDLKEIADYVNEAGSPFQAVFNEKQPGEAPNQDGNANATTDDRIAPALQILKDLMSRVKERQDQEDAKKESEKPEAEMLNTTDSKVVGQDMTPIFVSLDGDNIGNAVARAEEKDDEKTLSELSARINQGQEVLKQWAERMGGKVVEQGGDEGLVKVPSAAKAHIEDLRQQYSATVGATCTVGVGKKISESTKARMLGKLKGKNRTEEFSESTEKELELKLKDSDQTESNKIRTAMSDAPAPQNPGDKQPIAPTAQPTQGNPNESQTQSPVGQAQQPVQQEASPKSSEPQEGSGQEESPSKEVNPELLKAVSQMKDKKPTPSLLGNAFFDRDIEGGNYEESEDPKFSKAMAYIAKYGVNGNG